MLKASLPALSAVLLKCPVSKISGYCTPWLAPLTYILQRDILSIPSKSDCKHRVHRAFAGHGIAFMRPSAKKEYEAYIRASRRH